MALRREDALRTEAVPYKTKKGSYQRYWFHCSVCGDDICSQHIYLSQNSGKCASCSHKMRPYQAAYGNLVNNRHARKVHVELTYDQFAELCTVPNCHYCSAPLNRTTKRDEPHYRSYLLDRKDNAVGYTFENCVPCCWPCNQSKGNRYTHDEFLAITRALVDFRKEQNTPHWREEFMWTDGDDNPNPYMPLDFGPIR